MASFKEAFRITSAHEGGYSNHGADKGGETYAGISRVNWPGWPGWKYIDAIKKTSSVAARINSEASSDPLLLKAVEDFYKQHFWDKNRLNEFNSQAIANEVFDTGVNMGTTVAARFLQEALVLLGDKLVVDGLIGNMTIARVNAYPSPNALVKLLNLLQGQRYLSIVKSNPSQKVFLKGWLNRV